jgi:hypothetical protein
VTSKSPVGDISVVTLIRTDTTLDHSQKAEKVCSVISAAFLQHSNCIFSNSFTISEASASRMARMAFIIFTQPHCLPAFVEPCPRWCGDVDDRKACRQANTNTCSHTPKAPYFVGPKPA